jgi:ABC-type amino acid transport system permease subunit
MEIVIGVLVGLQVITLWLLRRLRKVVKANSEIVRITPMLLEIVALQNQLQNVQIALKDVQSVEEEFKRIIGNL